MPATPSDDFLEAAAHGAHRLAADAVWHRGRCNWVGPAPGPSPAYAALSTDLYNGTAGVALFLAEAAVCLEDARLAAAARGAIRQALDNAEDTEGGLYFGPLGVALAAARVAAALDDESLLPHRLLARWRRRAERAEEPHVAGGWAGVILALLALGDHVDAPWLTAASAERGECLLAHAERTRNGWSWKAFGRRDRINVCGLFHGTAGIGLALLELSAATGDERFREAAEHAGDYERAWRRRAGGAWPDLRYMGRSAAADAPLPVAAAWCHGPPGCCSPACAPRSSRTGRIARRPRTPCSRRERSPRGCSRTVATTRACATAPRGSPTSCCSPATADLGLQVGPDDA